MIKGASAFRRRRAFGTAGIKILASKDAKKCIRTALPRLFAQRDFVMKTVTKVQENAEDVMAEAKQINEGEPHRKLHANRRTSAKSRSPFSGKRIGSAAVGYLTAGGADFSSAFLSFGIINSSEAKKLKFTIKHELKRKNSVSYGSAEHVL